MSDEIPPYVYYVACPKCDEKVEAWWGGSRYDHFVCGKCGQSGWAGKPVDWGADRKAIIHAWFRDTKENLRERLEVISGTTIKFKEDE